MFEAIAGVGKSRDSRALHLVQHRTSVKTQKGRQFPTDKSFGDSSWRWLGVEDALRTLTP
jgi:hypothetical protein